MSCKIKICGLKRLEDIAYVNECEPDYAGFVFAGTKRKISKEQAAEFKKQLSPNIQAVGVFVNAPVNTAAAMVNEEIIDLVQLHGDEDIAYIEELRKKMQRGTLIKAVRVKDQETVLEAEKFPVDYLLFDTYAKGNYGGTGQVFDWKLLSEVTVPFFLAGGIGSSNIKDAIRQVHPYALDLSSAVETDGIKDRNKILEVVKKVRAFS